MESLTRWSASLSQWLMPNKEKENASIDTAYSQNRKMASDDPLLSPSSTDTAKPAPDIVIVISQPSPSPSDTKIYSKPDTPAPPMTLTCDARHVSFEVTDNTSAGEARQPSNWKLSRTPTPGPPRRRYSFPSLRTPCSQTSDTLLSPGTPGVNDDYSPYTGTPCSPLSSRWSPPASSGSLLPSLRRRASVGSPCPLPAIIPPGQSFIAAPPPSPTSLRPKLRNMGPSLGERRGIRVPEELSLGKNR
ncbi:hypothetical protein F5Y15DRAFT_368144 [Xylariaceae sp. FL0016]|nr:hypothetical protein F5Y15DRAFT_368144 [Xylariaceae sp. FL0016]